MAEFGNSENASDPPLCANNCGFYGNPKNHNLCSICYAAFLKENPISISTKTAEDSQRRQDVDDWFKLEDLRSDFAKTQITESDTVTNPSCSESAGVSNSNPSSRKNRCVLCNKKVGLLGFNCRCGGLFCGKHRLPEEHECGVDLKVVQRARLAEQNVECKSDKLEYRV